MSSRRLRGTQPPSNNLKHTSSSSSLSSGRPDRPARAETRKDNGPANKSQSPLSSEDPENTEQAERETRLTRQQKRGAGNMDIAIDLKEDEEQEDEDADGEITRCVCGQLDYPGPPVPLTDGGRGHPSRDGNRLSSLAVEEGLPEDAGGLFIQCDECHVWQHGGCVGIMEESATPENYYCEHCRKELHRVMIGARGQRYSRYLPVVEAAPTRTSQRSSSTKDTERRSSKESESKDKTALLSAGKRRSTMNSRTAYDEEEMLRKAIEESRGEGGKNGNRKVKRTRDDDSDETKGELKRRKTGSESEQAILAEPQASREASEEDSGEGQGRSTSESKKPRNSTTQAQRDKERQDREKEKEAERAEAAGRRSGRAERRRVDESEGTEETPAITKPPVTTRSAIASKSTRTQSFSKPAQQQNNTPPTTTTTHKKRPAAKRGRVGRNQYTKDRDQPSDKKDSPRASHSRGSEDIGVQDTPGPDKLVNGAKGARVKYMNPGRTSMNDLRKRAAGILEYITRTQVELAGTKSPSGKDRSGSSTPSSRGKVAPTSGSKLRPEERAVGVGVGAGGSDADRLAMALATKQRGEKVDETSFKGLTSLEMMDVLTRELVHWQKDYGKYGEK